MYIFSRNGKKDTTSKTSEELLDFFLLTIARKKKRDTATATHDHDNSSSSANNDDSDEPSSSDSDDSSLDDPLETMQEAFNVLDRTSHTHYVVPSTSNSVETEGAASSSKQVNEVEVESNVIIHREANDDRVENKVSYNITVEPMVIEEDKSEPMEEERKNNRDKFDSGLGDELLISELPVDMVEAISSSSDEEQSNKRCKRGLKEKEKRLSSKWRKIDRIDTPKKCDSDDSSDNEDKSDSDRDYLDAMNRMKMYMSPYSVHMKSKIQQLPLPSNVKKFLNFYREF